MMLLILSTLLLPLSVDTSPDDSFFISAPKVFHEGVKEKVFVQMGKNHRNKNYIMYLKHEGTNEVVSELVPISYRPEKEEVLMELMINSNLLSALQLRPTHLMLVAEASDHSKHMTWVQLSPHRGYIFIQTNQPVYRPMDKVTYRVFTLDHTFRPWTQVFHLSIYNPAGHRVMKVSYTSKGLFEKQFIIDDVAKTGTWLIKAHYEGDAANAVTKEFKVQKFVMPTFEVNIQMDHKYILVKDTEISFPITARYSHSNSVNGAYHCQFGVIEKGSKAKPIYIRGMEQAGSVTDGTASFSVNITKLKEHIDNQLNLTLSDMEEHGKLLYLGVFVTDTQNGEIQEQQISLPVVTYKYKIDISRIRSHFLPGFPIDVAVLVHLPDGSAAEKVPVTMTLLEETKQGQTNQQGAVFGTFNTAETARTVTLTVSVGDSSETKVIIAATSPTGSYLYVGVHHQEYSVGDTIRVGFQTKNAPSPGSIYYMVLSRGSIIQEGHVELSPTSVLNLQISGDMVPSFRLIGFFYTQNNDIISDSVWLSVKDNCEEKVKVKHAGQATPGTLSKINIDLEGEEAMVALLAVDTALYSLNAYNRLTAEEVHSAMEAYDLGCTYGGGADSEHAMFNAGLAFFTQKRAERNLNCQSTSRRKRSVDFEQQMMDLKSKYEGELQSCCARGFLRIPMQRTCEERAQRVSEMQYNQSCYDAFLTCCREGQRLREQKYIEEAQKGLGRTESLFAIQEYILSNEISYIRKQFLSSIAFQSFHVKGKGSYDLILPDSITTWEIQVITLSSKSGLCIAKPSRLLAFKPTFVSLSFPYSVKKYEQMYISPVIYNYSPRDLHAAVHMEQSDNLCSPGSATTASFVNITVSPDFSQTVIFTAVPMKSGSTPIRIRVYDVGDIENVYQIDAIEKPLNVWTEGVEKTEEDTIIINLNETNSVSRKINGNLPDDTVPDSTSNIFITMEENGFGRSHVKNILDVSIPKLTIQPYHCLEQTTSRLVPTALAVRYLDLSDQWITRPAGDRDEALDNIKRGIERILQIINTQKKSNGGYSSWPSMQPSTWLTSHVVKVLSLLSKQQLFTIERGQRKAINIPIQEITEAVRYLHSKQQAHDGSFRDANPVLHRSISGINRDASMTAFVTIALRHSLALLDDQDKSATENVISKATSYLWSNFNQLDHPLALAMSAYTLSAHKNYTKDVNRVIDWAKFQATDSDKEATAVETSAYALLTAVALKNREQAHSLSKWLTTQENYYGGFYSSQDTLLALEALAEYELTEPDRPEANMRASFRAKGKHMVQHLQLENQVKVEKDLKRFVGNEILADFTGHGQAKVKVVKVFHLMEPKEICNKLSIEVTVKGKVRYTAAIKENYEYYEDDDDDDDDDDDGMVQSDEPRESRSAIEWFDLRTRRRREVSDDQTADNIVTYEVCVKHDPSYNLTGMTIVDITLLSGFVAEAEDLEALKAPPEQYISHFALSEGKVLIYLNELFGSKQCFEFDAKQLYTVALLQPAPASFYDYYEPTQKCTVFYSAPKRSKLISKLCSGDVCQCAERPCHKLQNTFEPAEENNQISSRRQEHACFYPIVDYGYMAKVLNVSEKSNFELYKTEVMDVLKWRGDSRVRIGSYRTFAKRRHCKGKLELGTEYLIMGKDGSTTDSDGQKQYLLEANTWVEPKPTNCDKTSNANACSDFDTFVNEFKISSCKQ